MPLKIIQWASGGIGTATLRAVIERPEFELVGLFVYSDDKVGRDAGEIAGLDVRTGIVASNDKNAMLALEADCVIHVPMLHRHMTDEHHGDVMRLLESGKNVITTLDYFFPPAVSPEYAQEVARACAKGGTTLMGIGNSPGFICERVTTTISSHCLEIDRIDVLERMDCSYMNPLGFPVMGFGMTPAEFESAGVGTMWDPMYRQVPAAVCHILGAPVQRIELTSRIGLAERELQLPHATVKPGRVIANAWKWTAYVEDRPFFAYETQWVLDPHMPGWETDNSWLITIHGKPSIQVSYKRAVAYEGDKNSDRRGGHYGDKNYDYGSSILNAAAGVIINAVPGVCAAAPGHFLAPVYGAYQYRQKTQ